MTERTFEVDWQAGAVPRAGAIDRWARGVLETLLARVRKGEIELRDGARVIRFGRPGTGLLATIRVRDPRFYRAVVLRGTLGAGESYMDGFWGCDDLAVLVRIMVLNQEALNGLESRVARLAMPILRVGHALRRNSLRGSRRNITSHYDLGNEFFELFLDSTLTYSSGIFEDDDATLEQASIAKYERICRKLALGPGDHVLEIGSGWGGFAIHAARHCACRVTTTTISRAQWERARQRVAEAGLSERIEVLLSDYRELRGSYDKIVSIEMIEAVGYRNLGAFFQICSDRLRPDGSMLLQAISVLDRELDISLRNVDFIKKYIFPGGQLVSLGAICAATARSGDLQVAHVEDITPHYARTLACWRRNMLENLDGMRALGLGESFLRMWEFYLAYCEGSFAERAIASLQIYLEKPGVRREPILGALD